MSWTDERVDRLKALWAEGMSASLRRGLQALPHGVKAAMVLLADLPEVTTSDIRTVLDAVDVASPMRIWRATTEDGAPGHPIVFAAALFDPLKALTGDSGGAEVIKAHPQHITLVPLPSQNARLDLDTPEDWAAWRAAQNGSPDA